MIWLFVKNLLPLDSIRRCRYAPNQFARFARTVAAKICRLDVSAHHRHLIPSLSSPVMEMPGRGIDILKLDRNCRDMKMNIITADRRLAERRGIKAPATATKIARPA